MPEMTASIEVLPVVDVGAVLSIQSDTSSESER